MKLWNDYFNNRFSGYAVFNICGAYCLLKWFAQKERGSILELGGGTGGAAVKVFSAFRKADILHTIDKYVFSDVSPLFLRVGNRAFTDLYPETDDKVELKTLDFNKPFSAQKIHPGSFDAIYAVNALHVSYDLLASLKEIYTTLKEKGILVISELVRMSEEDVLPQEIIFTLLDSYYNVKTDSLLRRNFGFLTPEAWKRHFTMAGFNNIEMITNADYDTYQSSGNNGPVFMLIIKGQK